MTTQPKINVTPKVQELIDQLGNPVEQVQEKAPSVPGRVVRHVVKHKKGYALAGALAVSYKLGGKNAVAKTTKVTETMIAEAMNAGVTNHITKIYAAGHVALDLPLDEYQLFLGAAVNAGKITSEIARDSAIFAEELIQIAKDGKNIVV